MIPGVSGDLLSGAYLAAQVDAQATTGPPGGTGWMRAVLRWWRRAAQVLGPATAHRAMLDIGARPLLDLLGLRLAHVEGHPWGHAAVLVHADEPVATLICARWGTTPATAWRQALRSTLATRLPWALVFSGGSLSLIDATRPWARRSIAFDLAAASRHPRALAALWMLGGGHALRGGVDGGLGRAVAGSDAAGSVVCSALGRGVLDALQALMRELGSGTEHRPDRPMRDRLVFDQCLTIVYRLLFLLFAEARQLLPMWHRVYRDAYSMAGLCNRLIDDPDAPGVWDALQAMARLSHAGCDVDDLRVTAFNGRLFAPARTPLAEHGRVRDGAAAEAVLALGTTPTACGRRPVAFHDLGVEQLGAVYERVLEYEPVRLRRTLALRRTSAERKATGSFYTPRAMTDFLVRRTLGPLVEGRSADAILALKVLDPAMGSGAFLVAACRFLAERVEQARIAEGAWVEGDITATDRAGLARSVAERCLYGIDRNPTAVQLARLSLWLTTLAADRPLTFLDHHLAVGNSLIGARLVDLGRPPGRAPEANSADQRSLFGDLARQAWGREVVPGRHRLEQDPSNTAADVRDKERLLDRIGGPGGLSIRWSRAADVWCGLALQPGRISPGLYADLQQHVAGEPTALPSRDLAPRAGQAMALARAHAAVHWELLFPEVFLDEEGAPRVEAGFDAVLGNPPWDVMRADTGDGGRRATSRADAAAALRFIRASGQYPLHSTGHVNQYQLFLERALQALAPGGRFGLILPVGLQCDVGSAGLRRALLDRCRMDTWMAFDNRRALFPIHRSVRFLLLAGTSGDRTTAVPMMDGGSDVTCLTTLPDDARSRWSGAPGVTISRGFLDRWDPVHLTVPDVVTPLAMAVAARAMALPRLSAPDGWGVTFGRELNATDDRKDFVPRSPRGSASLVPVIEGKHVRPFAVDTEASTSALPAARASALLGTRWTHPRICYRDVASSTNRLTLIAAVLPSGVVSTHTLFCARTAMNAGDTWCLTGLLNSLVANYLVRLQVTTHVTTALMARLPVPRPASGSAPHGALAACAQELSRCGSIEQNAGTYARLNALAAALYGLTEAEYAHIVSTFPLLPEPVRSRCIAAWGRSRGLEVLDLLSPTTPPSR
jgi:hypothetical protein